MQKQREHWSSHLGFVLAAAGSAIGLGTLWKFPYVTGENGGGLFVLVYILLTLAIGVPVFIAELALGRRAQRGAVGIFSSLAPHTPFWKVAGWLGVAGSFLLMSYYSVLSGWGMNYAMMSLMQFYKGKSPEEIENTYALMKSSWDITLFWNVLFTAMTVGVVYTGVRQGIEYWAKIMCSGLFILLLFLGIYSMTLPGFPEAFQFIFSFDFSKFKAQSAMEALGLAFFTLSLGQGIMLTYGSYMPKSQDIPKTTFIVAMMIILISLLAALVIFPVVFTFGKQPEQGMGLVFKTLPLLFSQLPGALLVSTLFFILFVFTALSSTIAMLEAVAANMMDLYGWSRHKAVLLSGSAIFLMGIPSALAETNTLFARWKPMYGINFLETVDAFLTGWVMPIGGLLAALFLGWYIDKAIARDEFESGSTYGFLFNIWLFTIRWIVPVAVVGLIMQKAELLPFHRFFG